MSASTKNRKLINTSPTVGNIKNKMILRYTQTGRGVPLPEPTPEDKTRGEPSFFRPGAFKPAGKLGGQRCAAAQSARSECSRLALDTDWSHPL